MCQECAEFHESPELCERFEISTPLQGDVSPFLVTYTRVEFQGIH